MFKILKMALSDTIGVFGGLRSAICTILAIPLVGFCVGYLRSGKDAMKEELEVWLIYGLAGTGIVFIGLFLLNLICAPYRLERNENKRLSESNESLEHAKKHLEEKALEPEIQISINNVVLGGEATGIPDKEAVFLILSVMNKGFVQTICQNWKVALLIDDVRTQLQIYNLGDVSLKSKLGRVVELSADKFMTELTKKPVEVGGIAEGFLSILIDKPTGGSSPETWEGRALSVSCEDFRGNSYEIEFPVGKNSREDMFIPIETK